MKEKNSGPIITEEIHLIEKMIVLFYKKNPHADIPEKRMLQYAKTRLEFCQFGEQKTTCGSCPIHCYQPKYRQQIKQIMRYSGPRMIIRHPVLTIKHMYRGLSKVRTTEKK